MHGKKMYQFNVPVWRDDALCHLCNSLKFWSGDQSPPLLMEVFGERETWDHILTTMSSARLAVYKHVFTQHGFCQRPSNMGQNSLRAYLLYGGFIGWVGTFKNDLSRFLRSHTASTVTDWTHQNTEPNHETNTANKYYTRHVRTSSCSLINHFHIQRLVSTEANFEPNLGF